MKTGALVQHDDFGVGTVKAVMGGHAEVEFYGEVLTVPLSELTAVEPEAPTTIENVNGLQKTAFRRAFEAVNLGVVPPHPDQLLALSVGGAELAARVDKWLHDAPAKGLCKVIFGDYGYGKTHHLRMMEALALKAGWVVSFVEFDPKQADPAKPHLVYAAIMAALRFPKRVDGSQARGFYDFVGEVRQHWAQVSDAPQLRASPWFDRAFEVLRRHPHDLDSTYIEAVAWLSGQIQQQGAIRGLAQAVRLKAPGAMPKMLESSEIYVHHLVVMNEMCRRLGYRGLLILLDEAEHVRGFTVNRKERAGSFFDALAQSAHAPNPTLPPPPRNAHGADLPPYWKQGPHFGLVVALTEGEIFASHHDDFREACVFLHDESDMVRLAAPTADAYERWCLGFLEQFREHYPADAMPLGGVEGSACVAAALADEYRSTDGASNALRTWTKLASYAAALMFAGSASTVDDLVAQLRQTAREVSGQVMPWEV